MVNIHLRRCACCTPRKPSGRDGAGDKLQQLCSTNTWSPELLRPGKGTNTGPTKYVPLWSTRVPEPERLRPGKCIQPRAGLRQFQVEQELKLELKQCRQGKHTRREWGQTQCGWDSASTRQCYLFAVFLPPHSTTEQASLKKCPPPPPWVRAEIRHWRDQQTEEAKTNRELPWKWQVQ